MLLGLEASTLVHSRGIDWNASPQRQLLFLKLNGLAMSVVIAALGLGMHGSEMATAEDLARVASQSERAINENEPVSLRDGAGPCSFTPATRVTIAQGNEAIDTLQVGEKVLAYNPKTHTMELQPILHVWVHTDNDLVDLTMTTTSRSRFSRLTTEPTQTSEVVHTNQKHPFLTLEQGFLSVSQITLGMHLLRADGRFGLVTGWKMVPGTQTMYNLEVAQDHTFTVGDGQWVVHNSGGDCGNGTGGITYSTTPKIDKQINTRGWTNSMVDDALNNPVRTVQTQDNRHLPSGGQANDPATAYYYQGGGYVVRNDITGDIVQVSDRSDPGWIAPWDINQEP